MEGVQFTSTVCASMDRPTIGRVTTLRGFPDYSKDADAALAELPYNSLSQLCLHDDESNLRETRDHG